MIFADLVNGDSVFGLKLQTGEPVVNASVKRYSRFGA